MRFAQYLSLLAAGPGFASRPGSKPNNNSTVTTTEKFALKEADLNTENRAYCEKCASKQFSDNDHRFFYSWKIAVVAGEKRLIVRCAPKWPEESEGFTSSASKSRFSDFQCGKDFGIPEASDVKGVNFESSTTSRQCVDILPKCKECAKKTPEIKSHTDPEGEGKDFFWKVVWEGSKREIYTECAADFVMSGGWERSPPTQVSGLYTHFFQTNQDWCEKTFKDDCGAPQASAEQQKGGTNHQVKNPEASTSTDEKQGGTNHQETGGTNHQVKNPEASTDGRGLLFWLKLFGVLVVVVVAAAAGLYLGCKPKADDKSSD